MSGMTASRKARSSDASLSASDANLEPGFVLTIEPGVYFLPELMDLWRSQNKFTEFINYDKLFTYKDFSGIRNEEDYLITENGARLLGKKIPLHAEDVEAVKK